MLTEEQIDRFHRDGLLVIRGVFDRDEVRALQRAADEVTAEAVAGRGTGHGYREVDGRRQYYRTDGVLWDRDAAFRMATVNPRLLSAVGQCLDPLAPGSALRGTGRAPEHVRDSQLRLRHLPRRGDGRERLPVRARRLPPGGAR